MRRLVLLALTLSIALPAAPLAADVSGEDAPACRDGKGTAIQVNVLGLKDTAGEVWVEVYPGSEADFLAPDWDLRAKGKFFRRARARPTGAGETEICVRVPHPGQYSLIARHNRTGHDKFSFWSDGAGFPGNQLIGRSKPKFPQALINAGDGVTVSTIKMQYMRGFSGFGPI